MDPQALAYGLRAYGLYCFEKGLPRYLFVYAITGVQDLFPLTRAYMSMAWQIDKKWQQQEPGCSRSVLPAVVIRAACCLACMWGWHAWLAIMLLGFAGMLHPAEMMALVRRDLIFPVDVHFDSHSLFVKIRDPKTARFARRQHCRIDDPSIIQIVSKAFGNLPACEKLYPGTMNTFRRQWNCIMLKLGVPHAQSAQGATPGVLRGSGATWLYMGCEDINLVAWRGRWSRIRTLEYYLQEVAAYVLVHSLSPSSRSNINFFASVAWSVLHQRFLTE